MDSKYTESAGLFKALADKNRLMIIDMLSCRELCACMILEKFNFTQPTLSHHMKILCDCGLVTGHKEGTWMHYSLNEEVTRKFKEFLNSVTIGKDNCICNEEADYGQYSRTC